MNPLWSHFYGIDRPERPTAWDAVAIAEALGLAPRAEIWTDVEGFGGYSERRSDSACQLNAAARLLTNC
jgi:hypothetical protein